VRLSPAQENLIESSLSPAIFLEGPAGCGKTTAGAGRLLRLLRETRATEELLLLVPQLPLAAPYFDALGPTAGLAPAGFTAQTLAGLARQAVGRFWQDLAGAAGFARPDQPPIFLNLETAQYYLAQVVQPLYDQGRFDSLRLDRPRLHTQLLDNLNKAALVGFPLEALAQRLELAWGERAQLAATAQEAALAFRAFCLAHNLLDFSLLVSTFGAVFWTDQACRQHLLGRYPHLIVDNLEETPPLLHDLLAEWLPQAASALLIYDQFAGYRRFLGADAESAHSLKALCQASSEFKASFVTSPDLWAFSAELIKASSPVSPRPDEQLGSLAPPFPIQGQEGWEEKSLPIVFSTQRFHPQMLDWVADRASALLNAPQAAPRAIAILAPHLGDALRFALVDRLERHGLRARAPRPARAWLAEPAIRALLTLAELAHPHWGRAPARFEVAAALIQALDALDLVRAQLLVEIVYRPQQGALALTTFQRLAPEARQRITPSLGERYEQLRSWLEGYCAGAPGALADFWERLCAEVLALPGFNYQPGLPAGQLARQLVEAARHFEAVLAAGPAPPADRGLAFIQQLQAGSLPARYLPAALEQADPIAAEPAAAVLVAPVYTYLVQNQPVDYQFWLDIGDQAWSTRLAQPLTQSEVLSRNWPAGKPWSEADEGAAAQQALARLIFGLTARCRRGLFLAASQLDEQGYEQRGPLLRAVRSALAAQGGQV
jgi:hypothetical protein